MKARLHAIHSLKKFLNKSEADRLRPPSPEQHQAMEDDKLPPEALEALQGIVDQEGAAEDHAEDPHVGNLPNLKHKLK